MTAQLTLPRYGFLPVGMVCSIGRRGSRRIRMSMALDPGNMPALERAQVRARRWFNSETFLRSGLPSRLTWDRAKAIPIGPLDATVMA